MRKKILRMFLGSTLLVFLVCATSCSKTENSESSEQKKAPDTFSVISTHINGPLGDYFEIVDKNYKANHGSITVEIKRIQDGGPTKASWTSQPTFILDIMDSDEQPIANDATDVVFEEDQLEAIFALREGESSSLTFDFGRDAKKACKLRMASKWDKEKEEKDSDANDTTEGEDGDSSEPSFSTSNVILPSQLKGKVSVISASKSVDSYGFPEVSVTFKLLSKVNTKSMCSSYGQMWIVGVGQNASGVDVKELLPNYKEWRSDDSDGDQFKSFLEGSPGETITLDFTGSKDNSNNVSADLAKVAKFKLKITN